MEIIEGPTIETRPKLPYVGIRVVTPFRGMLGVRDELLSEVRTWSVQYGLENVDFGFLRFHVIDMSGDMDIEVGLVTRQPSVVEGRVCSGVFPAGRYATLAYRGAGTSANRALNEWVRDSGLVLDHWAGPNGDHFACRYEAYRTDPKEEPHKKRWKIELALKLSD